MDSNLSWRTSEEIEAGFESPTKQFESLGLELWITTKSDWNLWVTNLNPVSKNKAEGWSQAKGFESSSYEFESHLKK